MVLVIKVTGMSMVLVIKVTGMSIGVWCLLSK